MLITFEIGSKLGSKQYCNFSKHTLAVHVHSASRYCPPALLEFQANSLGRFLISPRHLDALSGRTLRGRLSGCNLPGGRVKLFRAMSSFP